MRTTVLVTTLLLGGCLLIGGCNPTTAGQSGQTSQRASLPVSDGGSGGGGGGGGGGGY